MKKVQTAERLEKDRKSLEETGIRKGRKQKSERQVGVTSIKLIALGSLDKIDEQERCRDPPWRYGRDVW